MIEFVLKAGGRVASKAAKAPDAAEAAAKDKAAKAKAAKAKAAKAAAAKPTGNDTGIEEGPLLGPELPTPDEIRQERELAAAATEEEESVIERGQAAERSVVEQKKRGELRKIYEKDRGKFELTGKTIRVPSPQAEYSPAAYLAETAIRKFVTPEGEETIPDYEEYQSDPGSLFVPATKSRKQVLAGAENIKNKIVEFDAENKFPDLESRVKSFDEQIKDLEDPELERAVKVLTTAQAARPIQLDLTKQRRSTGIKIAKNKLSEGRLNLYRQIENAVRDESDNYISLDPMVIDQEIGRLNSIAQPIRDEYESKRQERNRLRMALGYYLKLALPKGQDVTAEE